MTKLMFCGTPTFAIPSLKALLEDPDFKVEMVLSQPDRPSGRGHKLKASPVKEFALANNLAVETPESVNTPEFMSQLKSLSLDACVVVAYGQILKQAFLDHFNSQCVNIHGSLLPRWRGAAPIQRALMAGDKETGVSLQRIVRKLDAGPVIGERSLAAPEALNALELHDQLSLMGGDLLVNEFKSYIRGELEPKEQDESKVTHAEKISKEESRLNWSWPGKKVHDHIRGLAMGPYPWTELSGVKYKIHKTELNPRSGEPGTIVSATKEQLTVACGEGSLNILEIQPESKKKLTINEFLRGSQFQEGDRFES